MIQRSLDWRFELLRGPAASGGLVVDLFAGGGGASAGIEAALGRPIDIALNHDPVALAVHKRNHPDTLHLEASIWEVKPEDVTKGRPVDLLWASPDCTHFSKAKGDVPKRQDIRSLAWAVVRWAKAVKPAVIMVENVTEFQSWGPLGDDGRPRKDALGQTFKRWRSTLRNLGYVVDARVLDASEYGTPTRRKRLFIVARRDGEPICWPAKTHGKGAQPPRSAAECIDWSLPVPSIFDRKRPLAANTLARIAAGIKRYVLEAEEPFVVQGAAQSLVQTGWGERDGQAPRCLDIQKPLGTVPAGGVKHALVSAFLAKHFGGVVGTDMRQPTSTITAKDHHSLATAKLEPSRCQNEASKAPQVRAFLTAYYGSDATGGQGLEEPLRTIRGKDCLGLVYVEGEEYQIVDIGMRMLEPGELLRAQFGRFAESYDMSEAKTKTAKVRLIGNSVCPEVAEALVAVNNPSETEEAAA
jgi:DNA (cytosine-5)-methyltransferase 1